MSDILHITAAEPILHGVLKLTWDAGYEGIVDLRGTIAEGELFREIRAPDKFKDVRVADYGHSIYWRDSNGREIDFGCDRLREIAEEQAALLSRAG
jgi:hypothetical protein